VRFWIFWFAFKVLGRLPLNALYGFADFVGWASYALYRGQRENVLDNLRHVRPAAPEKELQKVARQVFGNVARNYADVASLPRIDARKLVTERLILHGVEEHVFPAIETGKGVVLLTCHFGNPELVLQGLVALGVKALALTEPLEPPRLSALMDEHRSSVGLEFVPVSVGSVRQVMKRLKQGGVVALTGDRDIEGPKQRMPFLGAETYMPTGPIEVALRTGAIVIPSFCLRRGKRFDAYAEEPLELERTGDMEADARRGEMLFLEWFERWLRKEPGQWYVLERVWATEEEGGRKEEGGGLEVLANG
jgi:KDO2-lipid IV(A) lauroyltransferase